MSAKKVLGTYPFIDLQGKALAKFSNFPLKFACKSQFELLAKNVPSYEIAGFTQAFSVFMQCFSSEQFDELEGLIELSMLQRLKTVWFSLKDLGYSMKLIGSSDSIKLYPIVRDFYSGSILPFRYLNMPSEYYNITVRKYEMISESSYTNIQLKDLNFKNLTFEMFQDLDLEKINREGLQGFYKAELLNLLSLVNKYNLTAMTIDVGVLSNYKILIYDKEGNLIEGQNNEDEEFHCFRFEVFAELKTLWSIFSKEGRKASAFYKERLKNYLGQYTIVDVDGFMNKNLLVPT